MIIKKEGVGNRDKTINSKAAMNIHLLFWYSNVFLVSGYACAEIEHVKL